MTTSRVTLIGCNVTLLPPLLKRSAGVVVAKVGKYAVNHDELLNALKEEL